jgi:hypothetical protein
VVFLTDGSARPEAPKPVSAPMPQVVTPNYAVDPVRVAVANGAQTEFSTIRKARAPFVLSPPAEADLIWDVGQSNALSRGDLIMTKVDGTVLGGVIDRAFAVREIRKLSTSQIIDVRIGEDGKSYKVGQHPVLAVEGVSDSYLTAVNIAADATIQMLFPFHSGDDPYISAGRWTRPFDVELPYGTDYTMVIATSRPAAELIAWLRAHNRKPDAFELPAVIAHLVAVDPNARVGAAGLYTAP